MQHTVISFPPCNQEQQPFHLEGSDSSYRQQRLCEYTVTLQGFTTNSL